jgi:hypothetical protein
MKKAVPSHHNDNNGSGEMKTRRPSRFATSQILQGKHLRQPRLARPQTLQSEYLRQPAEQPMMPSN